MLTAVSKTGLLFTLSISKKSTEEEADASLLVRRLRAKQKSKTFHRLSIPKTERRMCMSKPPIMTTNLPQLKILLEPFKSFV